jgi:hypothetical protein
MGVEFLSPELKKNLLAGNAGDSAAEKLWPEFN